MPSDPSPTDPTSSDPASSDPAPSERCPEASAYDLLGGEPVVRRLIDRFYDLMESEARFAGIRQLHPSDLAGSRDKLFWFLSGWLGGPALYWERIGHPKLRARHLPFPIGISERDQWLDCMAQALADEGVDDSLRQRLLQALFGTADWMRNREG